MIMAVENYTVRPDEQGTIS